MQADCGNLENEFVDLKLQSTKTKRDSFDDDYSDDYVENVAQRVTSRSDRFSVEGSPCIARMRSIENFRERKKVDLHPTPLKFHITDDKLNEVVKQTSLKVLVLDSTPNDISHPERQILEHQENSFRTFLLCGEVPSDGKVLTSKATKTPSQPFGCLRRPELAKSVVWVRKEAIQPPTLTDLLRVHDSSYLTHLEKMAAGSGGADMHPPFYPSLSERMVDNDTPITAEALSSAKLFCGAAMLAVDLLMQKHLAGPAASATSSRDGAFQRALVVGRPPGHHAGPFGCVPPPVHWKRPDMTSSGFCLLNSVAVAAAYARHHYGRLALTRSALAQSLAAPPHHSSLLPQPQPQPLPLLKPPRIAIVDIDIHHGNGTEEIVRNLRSGRKCFLPLPSSWGPVERASYFPWLNEQDHDEVLFASIHLFAESSFYPCSGKGKVAGDAAGNLSDGNILNIELSPVGDRPWDPKVRARLTCAQREENCREASLEFRSKVQTQLLPALRSFRPDLVFISAGFDAHVDDMYHFLTEADMHWVTQQICQVVDANEGGQGIGVVSVLEGGYSLTAPKQSAKEKKSAALSSSSSSSTAATRVGKAGAASGPAEPLAAAAAAAADSAASHFGELKDARKVFAQQPGDGGLVKSVLAHTAALAGLDSWT